MLDRDAADVAGRIAIEHRVLIQIAACHDRGVARLDRRRVDVFEATDHGLESPVEKASWTVSPLGSNTPRGKQPAASMIGATADLTAGLDFVNAA